MPYFPAYKWPELQKGFQGFMQPILVGLKAVKKKRENEQEE